MRTRYRVALNGQNLDVIADEIMILDVAYQQTAIVAQEHVLSGRNGTIVRGRRVERNNVTVTVEIHTQDIERRQEICARIQVWAMGGGWLTVNSRPNQRLLVRCDRPPVIGSDLKWTGKITIGFVAMEKPFWEDIAERAVHVKNGEDGQMYVKGSAEGVKVSASVVNNSGKTIDTMRVQAGETVFSFEKLSLESGKTLEIGEDEAGYLYIRAGGESKLNRRTAESDDELRIRCNTHETVRVDTNGDVLATFKARGLYM